MKIDKITKPIAADDWSYQAPGGETVYTRIEIGRPEPTPNDPNGDWYSPISIEGFTSQITPVYGVGPVDALNNAVTLLRNFIDAIESLLHARQTTESFNRDFANPFTLNRNAEGALQRAAPQSLSLESVDAALRSLFIIANNPKTTSP